MSGPVRACVLGPWARLGAWAPSVARVRRFRPEKFFFVSSCPTFRFGRCVRCELMWVLCLLLAAEACLFGCCFGVFRECVECRAGPVLKSLHTHRETDTHAEASPARGPTHTPQSNPRKNPGAMDLRSPYRQPPVTIPPTSGRPIMCFFPARPENKMGGVNSQGFLVGATKNREARRSSAPTKSATKYPGSWIWPSAPSRS